MFTTLGVSLCVGWKGVMAKMQTKGFCRAFFSLGISTMFNLIAGLLANYSSLYLNYSVSLMLRSSTLVFGCLISTFYLKRPLASYQTWGVALVLVAIVVVGMAAMISESTTTHMPASSTQILIWFIVRVLSKGFQAIAMLIEERIVKTADFLPMEVSGLSGVWSLGIMTSILYIHDNSDTWSMLRNSGSIRFLSLVIVIVFATWNAMCLYVTQKASAISRMILDQLTIVAVWIVQLCIWLMGYPKQGEAWNRWSWLQLVGYVIMVNGACIYQRIIKWEYTEYGGATGLVPLSYEEE
jgi:hypothetical protein